MTASSPGTALETEVSPAPEVKLRALLVEDNDLDAALVLRALHKDGFDVTADVVQDEAEFTRALRAHPPEVVLSDYNLPNWRGMDALKTLRGEGLDIPLILVSGSLGDVMAVECIKQGATDYVLKDGLARLPEVIRRALREKMNAPCAIRWKKTWPAKWMNWRAPTPTSSSSPMWRRMTCRNRCAW
jgi:DNA-binding NtrC family response regulator